MMVDPENKVVPFSPDGVLPATIMPPDEDLIASIEEILVDARSGHFRAIAYVKITRDRAIGTGWAGHADHHDMTAGVNMLAFRYMQASAETDE